MHLTVQDSYSKHLIGALKPHHPIASSLPGEYTACIPQLLFLGLGKAKGIHHKANVFQGFFKKREMARLYLCTDCIQVLSARANIVANLIISRISIASFLQRGC